MSEVKYNKNENYCTFSPESLFGVKFNYACFIHDRYYRNDMKVRKTRAEADMQLKNMIQTEFNKQDKQIKGLIVSWIYYICVRLLARRSWR